MPRKPSHTPHNEDRVKTDALIVDLRKTRRQLRTRNEQVRAIREKANASRLRYLHVFEGAPIGYVVTDSDGRISECNRIAAALLGDPAILRGQMFADYASLIDRPRFLASLDRCRRGRRVPRMKLELLLAQGSTSSVHMEMLRSKAADSPCEIRLAIMDLTIIEAAEEDLNEARLQMDRQVIEHARQMREAGDRLKKEVAHRERLEAQLLDVVEREQRRMGQDLHDDTCQGLAGLALEFGVLSRRLEKQGVEHAPLLRDLAGRMSSLAENVRGVARGLHPVALSRGLVAALQELTHETSRKVPCTLQTSVSQVPFTPEVELALYRIVQEALNNALKHAKASQIVVRLWWHGGLFHLWIKDNGVGLVKDALSRRRGMGMDILAARARTIGATLIVESLPRRGVLVSCDLLWTAEGTP